MTIQHVVDVTTAPSAAPPSIGAHYINTTTGDVYLGVGTLLVEDWLLLEQGGAAAAAVLAHTQDVDPHPQYATGLSDHEAAVDPHPQYTTPAEASAAAPVQSVNGQTGSVVVPPGSSIGDVLLTIRTPGAEFVPQGSTQLQASYPELFAMVGLTGGTPADGSSWVLKDAGFGAVGILGAAYGNGVWMVVGSTGHLARSTDGGATWTHITYLTDSMNSVATDGAGNWLAGGNSGKLIYSVDNGVTWGSATSNFGTTAIYSVSYGNGVWMIGGGSGKLYRSTTGPGGTYGAVTSNFGTSNIRGLSTDVAGVWVAAGYAGKIARSTDNGATWGLVTSGFGTTDIYSVETDAAGVWVAVGDVEKIARSTDNGATWSLVTSNYPAGGWIYGIGTDGAGTWVAAGNSGGWTRSTDGGATWTVGAPALPSDVNDVAYGGGSWVAPGSSGNLSVNLPSYPYNPATEFAVPAIAAPSGATAYIKAA